MAIVRTQEQHSIFTMSNFKENEKKWKEKQRRRTGYMQKFFSNFIETRSYAYCAQQVEQCRQNDVTNLHTRYMDML